MRDRTEKSGMGSLHSAFYHFFCTLQSRGVLQDDAPAVEAFDGDPIDCLHSIGECWRTPLSISRRTTLRP